jgi:hypothetical protein
MLKDVFIFIFSLSLLFFCDASTRFRVMASFYGASRLHSLETLHSVGLLWTNDQPDTETSTWQHTALTTNIHDPGEIRTHNRSKRAATDPRFRPRGYWDRLLRDIRLEILSRSRTCLCWYIISYSAAVCYDAVCQDVIKLRWGKEMLMTTCDLHLHWYAGLKQLFQK